MNESKLKQAQLPDEPGVYFFRKGSQILYIGKATSLRSRVQSYFRGDLAESRGRLIQQMVEEASTVTFQTADSVLEALILEANLIKKYQPPYNTREKDNKSFNYVVITDEPWPRILTVRGRELEKMYAGGRDFPQTSSGTPSRPAPVGTGLRSQSVQAILARTPVKKVFGPFTSGGALREALKLIRRIFPYRDRKCIPADEQRDPANPKPCFNRQIGLCPGVCTGEITRREYQRHIRNITLFFEGRKSTLLKKLEREMHRAAEKQAFEKAADIRGEIYALNHINDTAMLTRDLLREPSEKASSFVRIEAYDIAHLAGSAHVGVMTVIENGEATPSEYRTFTIKTRTNADDVGALREILSRRLNHTEWPRALLIVVDGARAQKNVAEDVVRQFSLEIPVVAVRKDERHKPRDIIGKKDLVTEHQDEILLANSEAHRFAITTHRRKLRKR